MRAKPSKVVETRRGSREGRRRPSAEQADGDDNWRGDSRSRSRSRRGDAYDEGRQRGRREAESSSRGIDSERVLGEACHSRGSRLATAEAFRQGGKACGTQRGQSREGGEKPSAAEAPPRKWAVGASSTAPRPPWGPPPVRITTVPANASRVAPPPARPQPAPSRTDEPWRALWRKGEGDYAGTLFRKIYVNDVPVPVVYLEAHNENYGACSRSDYEKVYDAVEIGQHDYCDPSGGLDCHGEDEKGMETNLAIGRLLLKEGGPRTHIMVATAPESGTHPWLQAAGVGPNLRKRSQAVSQALSEAHWLHKVLDGSGDY